MCCLTNGRKKNRAKATKKKHSFSLMKDRLVITSHYWVAGQRPQTFLLTKHTHTVVVNFRFFCFLCSFCCVNFLLCTLEWHLTENTDTLFSLWVFVFFHMYLFLACIASFCTSCLCLCLSHWWVVREGLSALLYKLSFKSLLEATGSAFKYSHLTHPNRGS